MTTTSIGQLRYSNTDQCYTTTSYKDSGSSGDEQTGASLQYYIDESNYADLEIALDNGSFDRNTDYYVKLDLPQSINYDYTFTIKLCKSDSSGTSGNVSTDTEYYQYLKTFTVPKGAATSTAHRVALYAMNLDAEASSVKAMCPIEVSNMPTTNIIPGSLYYDTINNIYYLGISTTECRPTTKINSTFLTESWKQDMVKGAYKSIEMVFRPVVDGMNYIKIQMTRTTQDSLITSIITQPSNDGTSGHDVNNGKQITSQGRAIQLEDVGYKLYELNNLVPSDLSSLSRIGVWSHSGLLMAVNGEEIRVGASGYYELAVLPVTSLGIVAQGYQDNWTVDYEYEK